VVAVAEVEAALVVVLDDVPLDWTWVSVSSADCRLASASATATLAELLSIVARSWSWPTWSPSLT
jgi:hypothetical protein